MSRKLTTEEFVEKARAIHGDRYDYSRVVYAGREKPVEIICGKHGPFMQRPSVHVSQGCGCPVCGREEQRETNMAKYGVPVSSQAASVKTKARETCRARYGGDGPQCDRGVREKSRATCLERYGADNPMGVQEFRDKIEQTHLARYGVSWAARDPGIRAKQTATCVERYGGGSPMCDPAVKAKAEAAMAEAYGVRHAAQSERIQEAIKSTCLEKYGVERPAQSEQVQAAMRKTCKEHYGVEHSMQSGIVVDKVFRTKAEHGTFSSSSPEEAAYRMLRDRFGADGVKRQYKSEEYPFACDFYVEVLDLYIEMNISWTHGGHFFCFDDEQDLAVLRTWKAKAESSKFYRNAIDTWTVRDVMKRQAAAEHGLNYLVFWRQDLADFRSWLESCRFSDWGGCRAWP